MGLLVGTLIHGQERVEEPLREAILQVGLESSQRSVVLPLLQLGWA